MEIHQAMKHQKKGKAPGPDGIIIEYYENLEDEITLYFKEVFVGIRSLKSIPTLWNESTITLIPKSGQDNRDIKKLQTNFFIKW